MLIHRTFLLGGAVFLLTKALQLHAGSPPEGDAARSRETRRAADECRQPELKKYLTALVQKNVDAKGGAEATKELESEAVAACRVARDVASAGVDVLQGPLVYYTVPAMSNLKRTMHAYPSDGKLGGPVRVIAAQGQFEAASLVLYPFAGAAKVELTVSELVGKNGTIPAAAVDLKIIKMWYQAGTAWYSYYADKTGRDLVPELLLNDENLVKVDRTRKENYLRVDYPVPRGSEYVWISNPANIDITFNDNTEPVRDATTLQPFSLTAGEFKQIWLTFEAPQSAEGHYTGKISVLIDGKPKGVIPIEVRVLPFQLPEPKTNYDLARDFYTSIYTHSGLTGDQCKKNGGGQAACYNGGWEVAKKRLLNEYVNMRRHNLMYPQIRSLAPGDEAALAETLELYKKAGLKTDVIFGAIPGYNHAYSSSLEVRNNPLEKQPAPLALMYQVDTALEIVRKAVGPATVYCVGADEPSMARLVSERKPWKYIHDRNLKTYNSASEAHLNYAGYNEDFVNYGGHYSREASEQWHAFGARISSYANPHTGPENPDFSRRTNGLDLYKANCDGTNNFILNWYTWNDFNNEDENIRGLNLIYPGIDAPIDTMAWEAYREAIDDVRYATLLKQLATQAIASGKTESAYQGRMALQWLALLDTKTCDLNAVRLEMIAIILKLRSSI